jgi:hypothetical protein
VGLHITLFPVLQRVTLGNRQTYKDSYVHILNNYAFFSESDVPSVNVVKSFVPKEYLGQISPGNRLELSLCNQRVPFKSKPDFPLRILYDSALLLIRLRSVLRKTPLRF